MSAARFRCTPRGGIARGRRRLRLVLWTAAGLMLAVAAALWVADRVLPALLCLAVAALAALSWRMSGDLLPIRLDLEPGRLAIRTRRLTVGSAIWGAAARRLNAKETEHLRQLTAMSGVTAFSGGFDSRLLGEFDLYASDIDNALLVEAGEDRWVLTPDDPEAFLAAFTENTGSSPSP